MKNLSLSFLFLVAVTNFLNAQNCSWVKQFAFNGFGKVLPDYKGNYYIFNSSQTSDTLSNLCKIDNNGTVLFNINTTAYITDININKDGNIVVGGNFSGNKQFGGTSLNSSKRSCFLASVSPTGSISWLKPNPVPGMSRLSDIASKGDNFIVIGNSDEYYYYNVSTYLAELSKDGSVTNNSTFTNCRGFEVGTDGNGNMVWLGNYADSVTINGQKFKTGDTFPGQFMCKMNSAGGFVWVKDMGSAGYFGVSGLSVSGTGNICMMQDSRYDKFSVYSYDANGTQKWAQSFGGGSYQDLAGNVWQTGDAIYVSGTKGDLDRGTGLFIKLDPSGVELNTSSYPDMGCDFVTIDRNEIVLRGSLYQQPATVCQSVLSPAGGKTVMVKMGENGKAGINEQENKVFSVFPNPSKGLIKVELSKPSYITVTNILGKVIYRRDIDEYSSLVDLSQEPRGIYFVKIGDAAAEMKKIVLY